MSRSNEMKDAIARVINEALVEHARESAEYIAAGLAYGPQAYRIRCEFQALCAAVIAREIGKCESPLEVSLLRHLASFARPKPTSEVPLPEVDVEAQARVGDYRVDFLIRAETFSGLPIRAVVEVDGHAFHERTKEQARRDKSRDRWLTANGYQVFRFTGSEVHASARACVEEIGAFLDTMERG